LKQSIKANNYKNYHSNLRERAKQDYQMGKISLKVPTYEKRFERTNYLSQQLNFNPNYKSGWNKSSEKDTRFQEYHQSYNYMSSLTVSEKMKKNPKMAAENSFSHHGMGESTGENWTYDQNLLQSRYVSSGDDLKNENSLIRNRNRSNY